MQFVAYAACGLLTVSGCARYGTNQDIIRVDSPRDYGERTSAAIAKGNRHYANGNLRSAAATYEKAIRRNPNDGVAHNNLGLIYFDQRKLVSAANHFDQAIQLLPDDPRPINNLAMTLELGGRVEQAEEYYHWAFEIDPVNPNYLGNLVRLKTRLGDNSEELNFLMQELAFIENRPDWLEWVDEQLALKKNPYLERISTASPKTSSTGDSPIESSTSADTMQLGGPGAAPLPIDGFFDDGQPVPEIVPAPPPSAELETFDLSPRHFAPRSLLDDSPRHE